MSQNGRRLKLKAKPPSRVASPTRRSRRSNSESRPKSRSPTKSFSEKSRARSLSAAAPSLSIRIRDAPAPPEPAHQGWAWDWELLRLPQGTECLSETSEAQADLLSQLHKASNLWQNIAKNMQNQSTQASGGQPVVDASQTKQQQQQREEREEDEEDERETDDATTDDLQQLELEIHLKLLQVKQPTVYEARKTFLADLRVDPLHIFKAQLFWYRFFDIDTVRVALEPLGHALWIFLQEEQTNIGLSRLHFLRLLAFLFPKSSSAGEKEAVREVDFKEWMTFVVNFGPWPTCFRRARALLVFPLRKKASNPNANLSFLRYEPKFDREKAEGFLLQTSEPLIVIRPGRGPFPDKCFNVSVKQDNKCKHFELGLHLTPNSSASPPHEGGYFFLVGREGAHGFSIPELICKTPNVHPEYVHANLQQWDGFYSSLLKYHERAEEVDSQRKIWEGYEKELKTITANKQLEHVHDTLGLLFYKRSKVLPEHKQLPYSQLLEKYESDWGKERENTRSDRRQQKSSVKGMAESTASPVVPSSKELPESRRVDSNSGKTSLKKTTSPALCAARKEAKEKISKPEVQERFDEYKNFLPIIKHHLFLSHVQTEESQGLATLQSKLEKDHSCRLFQRDREALRTDKGTVDDLASCGGMLLFATKSYFTNACCQFELKVARTLKKPVICLLQWPGFNHSNIMELQPSVDIILDMSKPDSLESSKTDFLKEVARFAARSSKRTS
eukprot:gb/GEZN01002291.1/.p1 GENE.gb/GEZN01002291.1/~~gb/GEZN01002291.1/.p1  ORF type:complete len:730 (+),score=128.49 gb/GEZN01002291.1/:59-2248(+)